jgi:hypothetical protein
MASLKIEDKLDIVAHCYSPSIGEAKAGRLRVRYQPGLLSKILPQNRETNKQQPLSQKPRKIIALFKCNHLFFLLQ